MTEPATSLMSYMPADEVAVDLVRELDVERAAELLRNCTDLDLVREIRVKAKAAEVVIRTCRGALASLNRAQAIYLRADRRLGEFLEIEGKRPGNPQLSHSEKLGAKELGLEKNEAARARELARVPEADFERHLNAVLASDGEKLTRASTIAAASSAPDYDSDEYYTPEDPWILAAREVMGGIDIDPCSCATAQNWIRAGTFYTKRDNGLTKRWTGRVWMNRPYSNKLSKEFGKKFLEELAAKRIKQGISLQNATPATSMFQRFAEKAYVCLPEGRINFNTANGKTTANRYDSAFFYVGPRAKRFVEVFGEFGVTGQLARMPARLFKRATTATTELAE
jgi:hypothetical protein